MDERDSIIEAVKISNKERGRLIVELIADYYIEHEKVKILERRIDRLLDMICNTITPGKN